MLKAYLSPVKSEIFDKTKSLQSSQWGRNMYIFIEKANLPILEDFDIAIVGVENAPNSEEAVAADIVRTHFYELYNWQNNAKIADLGNIKYGVTEKDTHFAVRMVITSLLRQGVVPIIIGGEHKISYGQFAGHSRVQDMINVVMFDQKVDLFTTANEKTESSFLYEMLTRQPHLSNYTHVGYQRYLVDPSMVDTLEKLHFECVSLGNVREQIKDVEPLLRNATMVSFDMSVIRAADAPAVSKATPNGLFGEEACRISRYAGMSDDVRSIGFYQFEANYDYKSRTAQLLAQMVWYFIEGFYGRKHDEPALNNHDYLKYIVNFKDNDYEITFLKSKKSDRWWMKVPCKKTKNKKKGYQLVPCSYSDYALACKDEIPDRWMKAFLRLS